MSKIKHKIVTLLLIGSYLHYTIAEGDKRDSTSSTPEQPRILTENGHLVFQTGANHNISFQSSSGGSIMIDGKDVKQVAAMVDQHQSRIQQLTGIEGRVSSAQSAVDNLSTDVDNRLRTYNQNFNQLNRTVNRNTRQLNNNRQFNRLKNKVNRLQTTVNTMQTTLVFDNCESGPCQHGGSCIDMYDSYRCFCPPNWQGTNCEVDVNECVIYQGTAQGCHSGATCQNTNGGFSCVCPQGWTGVLCNVKAGKCSEGSSSEICGHGSCVDSGNTHICMCDDGWTTDTATPPRCTVDIDECSQVSKPCHDSVQCINVPGSYFCGSCPAGFTGNGHQCNDINECELLNGGCSMNPRVECINTPGSRVCGDCPDGYEKSGNEMCVRVSVCLTDNGGCSPLATCLENPALQRRVCQCFPGYTGTGEGPNGCRPVNSTENTPCSPNPCQHGNCFNVPGSQAFTCSCLQGWTGHLCDQDVDECSQNVCQNGATCTNTQGNYTCQCPDYYRGRNCEIPTYQCGGALNGESGSFQFPSNIHERYPHNVSCAWRITTSLNKILMVTFTQFQIEAHSNCEYDFLQIHDGATASASMIGQFCGNDSTQGLAGRTLNSTHNTLYLWFKSDSSVNAQGFALTWRSATPQCGGDIRNGTSGVISSPGFPGKYPVNRTCVWTIRVPAGNNINIAFFKVALEAHVNCSYDRLEIRNGLLASDRLLNQYCSVYDTPPESFRTDGNEAFILFHSDASATDDGFSFSWSAIPAAPKCGGRLNMTDGIIISPNYPNHYDQNAECVWVVIVPEGQRITLNFTNFNLESNTVSCNFDFVQINDGRDDTAPSFGQFCGDTLPGPFTTTGNYLYLRFKSDATVQHGGFRAMFTVACGGTYTEPTGQLTSPFWPEFYPNTKQCLYAINAPEGKVIKVTFENFGIESGDSSDDECRYDSLVAYNGPTVSSDVIRRMCGSSVPDPVISTSNTMLLVFNSDGSVNDIGFKANYEFRTSVTPIEPSNCGGILTNTSGTIQSPGYPNLYPHGVECLWEIRVPAGFQIRLTFNFMSLEQTDTCSYDYIQVGSNITNTTQNLTITAKPENSTVDPKDFVFNTSSADVYEDRYCGTKLPPVFTSAESVLYVKFKSDTSVSHEGFSANYISFNHSWCGEERRTLPGLITSPNYPNDYPHQRECIWTIVAPDNHQIILNITDFMLEQHSGCLYDYLEIRNGGNELSPLVGQFCGNNITNPIVSHSNRLYIKFKSDQSSAARGFRIWYEDAGEGCGADLTGPSGVFFSPNYPSSYSRNAECYWTITVSQGSGILIVFADLDIEAHSSCDYDYVEVVEGLHTGRSLAKVCGSQLPQPIESAGNQVTVKFRSDHSMTGRGFHITYQAACQNRVLNDSSGVIESPNFPNQYPHNRNCSWIVQAPLGNNISVSFSHFEVEADIVGTACRNDFLEIRDGPTPVSTVLGRYCGNRLPGRINSTSNALYVRFISDASLADNGFRLEYATIGCGGDFNSPTGSFSSPNYPQPYPHNKECVWRITVPIGKKINLNISNVDLEFNTECAYDFLEMRAGIDSNAPLLSKICQQHNDSFSITSSGNQMYVRFRTDSSSGGTGFFASYSAVDGGCGAVYTTPSGSLHSPGYPNNYPHNSNCEWNITVAPLNTIQISFKELDIENSTSCIYDYVAIYDGLSDDAPELQRLCGSTNFTDRLTVTSSGNTMRVKMRTDSSSNGKGFTASYVTACGGRIMVGNEIGIIRSPNYPRNYDPMANCTWILMGSQAVDRVTLQFTHMDLEDQSDEQGVCIHDSVKVLQGDNPNAPVHGTYCGSTIPPSITSTSYALTVIFSSDASIQRTGFSASFSKSTSFCGGNLTAANGAFSTPNYPDGYPRLAECIWFINASPGNQIQLTFPVFDLEQSDGCGSDYVEIRELSNLTNLLGRFCGNQPPTNLTIAKSMYVKFKSDEDNERSGFMAQFTTLIGGNLVGNSGQLASPLYPGSYEHNQHVEWTIMVDVGKKVRIQFSAIDIEGSATCQYDYVKFLDGLIDPSTTELAKFCGTVLPPPFTSTTNVISVVFHSDVSSSGSGFLLSWSAVDQIITTPGSTISTTPSPDGGCRFELVAGETPQNISSPGYPSGYENNLDCTWIIRSTSGERIFFKLMDIDLESSPTCAFDKLRIFDADSALASRQIGIECGRNSFTKAFMSSAGVMTLQFTSDISVGGNGFFGSYEITCGGILTDPAGEIKSPKFPAGYPVNSTCTWVIQARNGRTISLTVNQFNLPNSANCTGDRLRILNGGTAQSPPIEALNWAYCGSTTPPTRTIESASRFVYVEFISDSNADSASNNFRITYTEKSVTCGGNLAIPADEGWMGTLTSPGFGNSTYPHNADCTWIITAPANARVQLDFNSFDMEAHSTCQYDYLLVRDGGTENSPELARLCGKDQQPTVRSTSNVIRLRMVTDDSVSKGGFNITYQKSRCGGTIIGTSGLIQTPQYPNNYPNGAVCEWYVEGPTGHYLALNFSSFQLGNRALTNCTGQDTLSVYDRDITGNISDKVGDYCGNTVPTSIRTSDSRAYFKFVSNAQDNFRGFSFNFVASVDSCGGDLRTPTGVISSPNYPNYYPHRRECYWKITAPPGRRIRVAFDDFRIEAQASCLFDYVEIFNGLLDRSPRIARFCGNLTSHEVSSTSNTMMIKFVSDGSVSNGGFSLSYTTDEPAVCGGILQGTTGDLGVITSPGYNETISNVGQLVLTGQYPNSTQCEWTIQGSSTVNSSIVLFMESNRFKLEHDGECRYDFLQIRQGNSPDGGLIGQFCSNFSDNVPNKIAVPGDQMWLAFVSDATVSHEGFNITYQIAPCGGKLRGDSGVITSPNYPNPYTNDMGCAWDIETAEGTQIVLKIESFDLEANEKCLFDYLTIYNGPSHLSPILMKLCKDVAPNTIYTSSSNKVRLEFIADYSQNGDGFKISYTTRQQGCGGIFNEKSGQLLSPNHPASYNNSIECVWDIIGEEGYHIIMDTNGVFDVQPGGGDACTNDFVEFYSINAQGDATRINDRRYCGSVSPPQIKSNENHLRVKFRSDSSGSGSGFNFTWTSGCGGIYTDEAGVLTSPGFPNNYGHNLTCDYIIRADPTQFIVLQFDQYNFRIETGSTCQYDSVSIFNYNATGTSLGSFCGLNAPQPLASKGQMLVRFKSDADTSDKGFRAHWVRSECGGYLNGTSGELKSPTHPVDYHNNLNCTWFITVASNKSVNLRFEEFDLEASSNGDCRYDYLAVYDGDSINSPLVGRFCGNVIPESIKSITSSMTVQFVTDSSVTKGGFRAIYTETYGQAQGCGGILNTTTGTIVPVRNGNGDYAASLDCVWTVIVPEDKVISFSVSNVDIEDSSSCDYDGLELIDGLVSSDVKMDTICGTRSSAQTYKTSTNVLRVRFFSDGSIFGAGFTLTYQSVDRLCGGILFANSTVPAVLTSPNYPSIPSEIPANCRWAIAAPSDKHVRLTVTNLAMRDNSNCVQSYLQFRDQPLVTENGNGQDVKYCGSETPEVFDSFGNTVQVNFKYNGGTTGYQGFRLQYSIATCDRLFTAPNGRILSPGYPASYPVGINCWMNISVPNAGHKIALYFNAFAMEMHDNCAYDYLEVYDGNDVSQTPRKYCGPVTSEEIISTSNNMLLHMVTDNSVGLDGFDLTYVSSPSGCGGTLTSNDGGIVKRNISSAMDCVWNINVSSRRQVTLNFEVLDLRQNNSACIGAYVEIFSGDGSSIREKVCDGQAPPLTTSNQLRIVFHSSGALPDGASFKLTYSTSERTSNTSRFRSLINRLNPFINGF